MFSRLQYFAIPPFYDSQLPANVPVTWNKKMRKTAGYCVTGVERAGGSHYARIELSEKVCDSAGTLPTKALNCCHMYARPHFLMLDLIGRSPQGHAHPRDVSRRDLAHKRCEGRPREHLAAVRSKSYRGASRAADGDPLPQLWHQIQVPVPVHPLQEYVRFGNECIETWHLLTGVRCLDLLRCVFRRHSPQDWASFEVAGHSEVCVRPLHGTAGFADALEAACGHTFCQLCERELRDYAAGASRTKPRRSDA